MSNDEAAMTEIEDAYHPLNSNAFLVVTVLHAGKRYQGLLTIDAKEEWKR